MPTVFISGEHPRYKPSTFRENNALMYELLEELRRVVPDKNIRLCQFFDRTTGYHEKSYRVKGLNINDAIRLGRSYDQESIFIEGKGLLHLDTMILNPVTRKHVGEGAYRRSSFNLIEGMKAIAYDIDYDEEKKINR